MKKPSDPVSAIGPTDVHLAAHKFQGARLTIARELRGLTRADLADRIRKTPSAVSQFEGARSRPDARTLAAISLALGIPLAFFTRATTSALSVDACHFRTLRSASQRERRQLLSVGTLLCELVENLEEHIEFPAEQVTAAAQAAEGAADIEDCVNRVRAAWGLGLGPIPKLVNLLQSKGIIVCLVPNTCREVDAFSAWHDGRPLVFLVNDRLGSRMRFDAAHELGHLVQHADVAPGSPDAEREANRFSAAFQVPREPFLAEWPGWLNWDHLFEMKRRWRMSASALVRRAYDLGVLTEASYRRANMQLRQHGPEEPFEPPPESPEFLGKALALLADEVPLAALARSQGLTATDIEALVRGDLPVDSSDARPVEDAQLSLPQVVVPSVLRIR